MTDIVIEDPRWQSAEIEALAERAALNTLRHLDLEPSHFEIAILACDDTRIATLNADFRGKRVATNVLSWPDTDLASGGDGEIPARPTVVPLGAPTFLGDIAIAFDTCRREAADADTPFHNHATHLMVHAILHLLGYDHVRDRDATLMEGLETEILGKMGISDPY